MSCDTPTYVPIDQDWEYEIDLTRKASATGEVEDATGLTVTARFSATKGGSALGSSSTSLTERASNAGQYAGVLAAATLTTALSSYVNQTIYEVYLVDGKPVRSRAVIPIATLVDE